MTTHSWLMLGLGIVLGWLVLPYLMSMLGMGGMGHKGQ